ncbi:hypothetical protein C2845_PM02G03360 [Panicum miliaceum]|uniref:Uncharacterized protein n=1 Tax=Panicum miliaceum TaxID=4540 RepID=A0A3L6SAZ3_PANMI|nr:hypothetical protein C2845_PM02G03360 [Panicum miliaceum]
MTAPRVVDLDPIPTPIVPNNHGEMIALKMPVQKLVLIRVMTNNLSIIILMLMRMLKLMILQKKDMSRSSRHGGAIRWF